MPISPLDDLRVEEWEQMIDINIKGVLYGIAAALPVFRKQGSGRLRQGRKKTVAGAICADNTPKDQKALWRVFSFISFITWSASKSSRRSQGVCRRDTYPLFRHEML